MSVNEPPRPAATYARATLEYDNEHERELIEAITRDDLRNVCGLRCQRDYPPHRRDSRGPDNDPDRRARNVAIGGTLANGAPSDNRQPSQTPPRQGCRRGEERGLAGFSAPKFPWQRRRGQRMTEARR